MGDGGGHGGRDVDWILGFVLFLANLLAPFCVAVLTDTVCLRYFMCFLAIFCDILSWTKIQEM
jgi:hypothetical protein